MSPCASQLTRLELEVLESENGANTDIYVDGYKDRVDTTN